MTRLNQKPVASGMYHHSYSPISVLSLDFAQLVPNLCLEVVKKDEFTKISGSTDVRVAPQIFPPFGKAFYKTAAFFVPESQIIQYSDALHNNQNSWKGKTVVCPFFNSFIISQFFYLGIPNIGNLCSVVLTSSNPYTDSAVLSLSNDAFDFVFLTDNSGVPAFQYCKLTPTGRIFYKILKALGYDFPSFRYASTYASALSSGTFPVNAMPLLSYAKIYCDMFLNGSSFNNDNLVHALHKIHDGEDVIDSSNNYLYYSSIGNITLYFLRLLFETVLLPHEQNLYTESWNSPNSPLGVSPGTDMSQGITFSPGLVSPYFVDDSNSMQERISTNKDGVFYSNAAGTVYTMTASGNRLFKAFDKFVKRFNLFGSKAVQRIYAAFGQESDSYSSDIVHKLYEGSSQITFHPVMSNAETVYNSQVLKQVGDFAGYGAAALDFSFDYKSRSYGYIISLSWIQVVPMMLRGFNPSTLRVKPYDFYTPELDGEASRAIPLCEVGVVKKSNANPVYDNLDTNIFGFTNLYDDYRELRDTIAGDFVVGSSSNKNFLFSRDYSVLRSYGTGEIHPQSRLVHYYDLVGNSDMSDPFQFSSTSGDRFWLGITWNIEANRPVKSINDVLNFTGMGDMSIPRNGNEMN